MSDVLDIARKKRELLKAEVTALDAFIHMGEKIAVTKETKRITSRPSDVMSDRLAALRVSAAE